MRLRESLILAGRAVLDLIYPSKCGLCATLGEPPICSVCRSEMQSLGHLWRSIQPDPLDYQCSLFLYAGRSAQAVRRLKFNRETSLVTPMATLVAHEAEQLGLLDVDVVVPVPIHIKRLAWRGFNQAELLCEMIDRSLIDTTSLRRIRPTRPQVGLTIQQRLSNLTDAFQSAPMEGKKVLLIDDVLTSGGTAKECARTLKAAGATEVGILTFCGWGDTAIDYDA